MVDLEYIRHKALGAACTEPVDAAGIRDAP
jgi:hypothetical protein